MNDEKTTEDNIAIISNKYNEEILDIIKCELFKRIEDNAEDLNEEERQKVNVTTITFITVNLMSLLFSNDEAHNEGICKRINDISKSKGRKYRELLDKMVQ